MRCDALLVMVGLVAVVPTAEAEVCGVRLVRVPAEVAPVIERRLGAIEGCGRRLDVWLVRTEDGLFLVAQDALGRVRERVVPDAEVAAALIASWVELDDAPAPAAAPPVAAPLRRGPSTIPITLDVRRDTAPLAPHPPRTFAIGARLGVTWNSDTASGATVEVEVVRRGAWFAALELVAVQEVSSSYFIVEPTDTRMSRYAELGRSGLDAMARVGVHAGQRVYLRPSLELGVGGARHEILFTELGPADAPVATTSSAWSLGVRLGVAVAAGVQLGGYAIELSVAEVADLQRGRPGVAGDDRALAAGLGLRFRR